MTESTIMSTNEMESLLEKKRTRMRNSVGVNIVAIKRGFIDTSRGVNLTSDSAMELARAREAQQTVKSATKRRKTDQGGERGAAVCRCESGKAGPRDESRIVSGGEL